MLRAANVALGGATLHEYTVAVAVLDSLRLELNSEPAANPDARVPLTSAAESQVATASMAMTPRAYAHAMREHLVRELSDGVTLTTRDAPFVLDGLPVDGAVRFRPSAPVTSSTLSLLAVSINPSVSLATGAQLASRKVELSLGKSARGIGKSSAQASVDAAIAILQQASESAHGDSEAAATAAVHAAVPAALHAGVHRLSAALLKTDSQGKAALGVMVAFVALFVSLATACVCVEARQDKAYTAALDSANARLGSTVTCSDPIAGSTGGAPDGVRVAPLSLADLTRLCDDLKRQHPAAAARFEVTLSANGTGVSYARKRRSGGGGGGGGGDDGSEYSCGSGASGCSGASGSF